MLVVGVTAGGAAFGVDEWHDGLWIDGSDDVRTSREAADPL
jgi:hypothetical protein